MIGLSMEPSIAAAAASPRRPHGVEGSAFAVLAM